MLSKYLKLKLQLWRGKWVEVQREVCGLCLGFRSNRWDKEFHYWYFSLHFLNIFTIEVKLFQVYTNNSKLVFTPGKPLFGTLIALLYRGKPVKIPQLLS
jgi:hypothetical protein